MADLYAPEVRKSLDLQGFMTRIDPTSQYATEGEGGRADILVLKNGKSCAVEVKSGRKSFLLSDWKDNQRSWSKIYCEDYFTTPYYLSIVIGEEGLRAPKIGERHAWLMPKNVFEETEKTILPYQKTIPYKAGKGYDLEMQHLGLDAVTLWGKL